jgi:hypothetical protein
MSKKNNQLSSETTNKLISDLRELIAENLSIKSIQEKVEETYNTTINKLRESVGKLKKISNVLGKNQEKLKELQELSEQQIK